VLAARSISKLKGSNTAESKTYISLQSHIGITCGKIDADCRDFNRMRAGYAQSRCKTTASILYLDNTQPTTFLQVTKAVAV